MNKKSCINEEIIRSVNMINKWLNVKREIKCNKTV